MKSCGFLVMFVLLLEVGGASAEPGQEPLSGPQPGERLPNLSLQVVLGPQSGRELDIVAHTGDKPLLLIFVHEVNRPSVGMARLLADYAGGRAKDGMHCCVIFLSDEPAETEAWMKRAAGALPKQVPLGISSDGREGPGAYGLNRKVTMTILLADKGKVAANFALVQPSIQADAPQVLQAIVDVVGGKAPTLAELGVGQPPKARGERSKQSQKQDD